MPSFSFNAKHFLLTYSHVEGTSDRPALDPSEIVDSIATIGGRCIVGQEQYNDTGGLHFHVFIAFESKFRSRRADVFDVNGYHPNVVPSRGSPERGWDYATKDGQIVGGDLPRPSGDGDRSAKERWTSIVQAESVEEFWRLLEVLDPQRLACNFPALQRYADWKFRVEPVPYESPPGQFDISLFPELGDWQRQLGLTTTGACSRTSRATPTSWGPPSAPNFTEKRVVVVRVRFRANLFR